MTKSFNEWLDTTKLRGYMDENSLEAAWEGGQQSKQAEVDKMKRQARKIMIAIDDGEYDWARRQAKRIFEGDQS